VLVVLGECVVSHSTAGVTPVGEMWGWCWVSVGVVVGEKVLGECVVSHSTAGVTPVEVVVVVG
jgi:hypothetical protein